MWLKICGITREADARLAALLAVDAVGFVLWPGSRRFVDPGRAAGIAAALPPAIERVGLFVDESAERIAALAEAIGLDAVQLHGRETPAFCEALYGAARPGPAPGRPARVIKAFRVGPGFRCATAVAFPPGVTLLLDADAGRAGGGTGRTIDWALARRVAARRRAILAGGLTPENVEGAIHLVRPHGVDVASGVESSPGVKDAERLRRFVEAVRRVES